MGGPELQSSRLLETREDPGTKEWRVKGRGGSEQGEEGVSDRFAGLEMSGPNAHL